MFLSQLLYCILWAYSLAVWLEINIFTLYFCWNLTSYDYPLITLGFLRKLCMKNEPPLLLLGFHRRQALTLAMCPLAACLFEAVGPVRATTIDFPLARGASGFFFFFFFFLCFVCRHYFYWESAKLGRQR